MTDLRAAVVLAAGKGLKFWPYSTVRNKVAFPIANVPAIRRTVDALQQVGIQRVVVVVGHGEASVRAALRGCVSDILYIRQPVLTGTAEAALSGLHELDEDCLIVSGDVVTARENLELVLARFVEERPLAAALIQPLGDESPRDWIVAFPDDGCLSGVQGHARGGSHRLCGVYAWRRDAFSYLQDNPGVMTSVPVGGMPPLESEIAQSLQMMIDERETVLSVVAPGYHVDLDKPWHVLEANRWVISSMSAGLEGNVIAASARIHDGAEIRGRVVLGEHASIGNRVVVGGDLWLGDGACLDNGAIMEGTAVVGCHTAVKNYCQIGGLSSLGDRGVYGHGAEFSGVALDTVYCYHYCEIWGVVGQAVDMGAATVCGNLRFDDAEAVWQVKGRSEAPTYAANAAYFGDFCRTGVNAIVMPGRRIGSYACLGPGVVAYEDVPDGQMVLLRQDLETRNWGPERYGW
jgi:NDP-sugar pyrophosphorylase family protein